MQTTSADPSSTDLETGVHNSWRLSPWSKKLHGAGLFIADEEEGQIEVPEAGLYLVYAQVFILCLKEYLYKAPRDNIFQRGWLGQANKDLRLFQQSFGDFSIVTVDF